MDKYFMWIYYERLHKHNKAKHNKTVCIFLGIYCISNGSLGTKFQWDSGVTHTTVSSGSYGSIILRHHYSESCLEYIRFYNFATVYPKKYAHGFVVLCFVVVMQSFIMNSHEVFIHIHQVALLALGQLPQCQWSKPDGYGKISQCTTTTKHSKAKTACIFLGIYCIDTSLPSVSCVEYIRSYDIAIYTKLAQHQRSARQPWNQIIDYSTFAELTPGPFVCN